MLGALYWAYIRYQTYPIAKEKIKLNKKANDLQAQIATNTRQIQRAQQKREELNREEQAERNAVLIASQNEYVRSGMNAARIEDADIPGVGHALKQRLALHGFTTAASISARVTSVEGFGPAKTQAMIDWHNRVIYGLNTSKPTGLTPEQADRIREKYNELHASNTEKEKKHQEDIVILGLTLRELKPRIQELAPISFRSFIWKALGIGGFTPWVIAAGLVGTQVVLGTSTTIGAIMASIPTPTLTTTLTFTPTRTFTLTITLTQTITNTPTVTETSTITFTPTITNTPTFTPTPTLTYTPTWTITSTPTITKTRTKTRTPAPYVSPIPPIVPPPSGNCDPSYPTVCIPPPPPDLDCGDIPFRRFKVLPPDPHNFDSDHDGIGCES
jgi:predicted flap endonuclease-1-like 5' DNA nuclease